MAENGTAGVEPKGLYMSLDAIIKEKGPEKKEHHPRQRNEGFQNCSHRGRGRRGPDVQGGRGRGRFHAMPQQGWQVLEVPMRAFANHIFTIAIFDCITFVFDVRTCRK